MIVTTTPSIEGRKIGTYLGIVTGEAIMGANIFKDFMASVRDVVGGRAGAYEEELIRAMGKRVLFLTKDPDLIRRQLTGELNLRMEDLKVGDLLDDINTDAMTPACATMESGASCNRLMNSAYTGHASNTTTAPMNDMHRIM